MWRLPLDAGEAAVASSRAVLSNDERERADRFRFERHRRRFTVARATLRRVLAAYVGVEPRSVRFAYGPQGKPRLAGPVDGAVDFNLSHSGDLAVLAVAGRGPLGVDVESLRPMPDARDLAERFFSARERDELAAVPSAAVDGTFFRIWTRKEALLKALGGGLSLPLDTFDVTAADPPRVRRLDPPGPEPWRLEPLDVGPGWVAALAAPGRWRVVFPEVEEPSVEAAS